MPVDGRLTSRREITGRALGTAGRVAGVFVEPEDLLPIAQPGKFGIVGKLLTPSTELKATDNIETTQEIM